MAQLPETIRNLIYEFNKLPGIGPKTSEKFVYFLLNQPREEIDNFVRALNDLKEQIQVCTTCYNFSEKSPCAVCGDPKRNKSVLCIVSESGDQAAIEKTGQFNGLYHILGGAINQIEGVGPDQLKIKELLNRIAAENIQEIILATNPDMEGETTAIYIAKQLGPADVKVTRLAKGLPTGADLEYADEMTLTDALKGRREV